MVALGHQLGADDEVELAALDFRESLAQLGVAAHVRREDYAPRIGEAGGRFFGDAFDAGADRGQAIGVATGATGFGRAHFMAAMVAHQNAAEAVLHHPGRTIGTLILMAAGAAQGQRGIAAPVEEQ
ncbi:hypothetical protein D9M68_955410 [compost metagenome]